MNISVNQSLLRDAVAGRAPRTVKVLGSQVDILDVDEAVSALAGWIEARDGRCRQVVVTGAHGLWEAHRDADFKRMVNSAALWVPDGIAPVWIARLRGIRGARRVPGAELMDAFLALQKKIMEERGKIGR